MAMQQWIIFCVLIFGMLFAFPASIQAQAVEPKTAQHLEQLMQQQGIDWSKGNLDGFMSAYWKHDSLAFISSKGITYGWKGLYERYQKAYPTAAKMGQLRFKTLLMRQLAQNEVFVVGEWHVVDADQQSKSGIFSLVFRRIDGQWKIISDHTS
jgi:ketosteroid isomerase-like protein